MKQGGWAERCDFGSHLGSSWRQNDGLNETAVIAASAAVAVAAVVVVAVIVPQKAKVVAAVVVIELNNLAILSNQTVHPVPLRFRLHSPIRSQAHCRIPLGRIVNWSALFDEEQMNEEQRILMKESHDAMRFYSSSNWATEIISRVEFGSDCDLAEFSDDVILPSRSRFRFRFRLRFL